MVSFGQLNKTMKYIFYLVSVLLIFGLNASHPASLVSGRHPNQRFLCNIVAPENGVVDTAHVKQGDTYVLARILRCRNLCKNSSCKAGFSKVVPILRIFNTIKTC